MLIDNEPWMQADVPIDFQHMVDRIARSKQNTGLGVAGDATHLADLDIAGKFVDEGRSKDEEEDAIGERSSGRANMQSHLVIGGKRYVVVNCCIMFVKMIEEYVSCARTMSSTATDVLSRLIEITKV